MDTTQRESSIKWSSFLSKFEAGDPNQCWPWNAAKDKDGYGQIVFGYQGKHLQFKAHRLSYIHFIGPIPGGMLVCHHCDNPGCVNPGHLFAGTPQQNMQDMIRRNRRIHLRGESIANSKLSSDQVQEIRCRYAAGGVLQRELGSEYGITQGQVSRLLSGLSWQPDV